MDSGFSQRAASYFESLQESICSALTKIDGRSIFREDTWKHAHGGGGRSRVLQEGAVFEKAGVNTSSIRTPLTAATAGRLKMDAREIAASGISLVLHPLNPHVPAVHANFRFLEADNGDWWFGGGADLTPYYLYEEDARHFHGVWKSACDTADASYYPRYKKWCDEYFTVKHRGESRGIGGIFFDDLRGDFDTHFRFIQQCGNAFLGSYTPIVERRRAATYGERERRWQLQRRGRYAEFNLVYDRGTVFGLETEGRVESILMSLPPLARWDYNAVPEPGSSEEKLLAVLRQPKSWI
ncbi:MAG: coproporphyrinogen III oxidase [Ignavibacteria bacterium GWC2_56_12]|nr:MAG: coproporphyrinogen III oxidase [Ignavibacteria bacterium GWC2_56_12]